VKGKKGESHIIKKTDAKSGCKEGGKGIKDNALGESQEKKKENAQKDRTGVGVQNKHMKKT